MPARSRPLTHYRRGPELAVFPTWRAGPLTIMALNLRWIANLIYIYLIRRIVRR